MHLLDHINGMRRTDDKEGRRIVTTQEREDGLESLATGVGNFVPIL